VTTAALRAVVAVPYVAVSGQVLGLVADVFDARRPVRLEVVRVGDDDYLGLLGAGLDQGCFPVVDDADELVAAALAVQQAELGARAVDGRPDWQQDDRIDDGRKRRHVHSPPL
jgi:hypothetical protein